VLLVEDNHVNQQVAVAFLRHLGYEADVAGDGEGALELFDDGRHQLVLMDCQLPGIDGYETTRRLRRRGAKVPVIALTAYALESERAKAFQVGMDDHLTKPLDREQLRAVLTRWTSPEALGDAQTEVEPSAHAVVDAAAMEKLLRDCDGDEEFVRELVTSWLQDVAGRLRRLDELTRAAPIDAKQVHREAHTIKGSALVFGLAQVVEAAGALEEDARASSGDLLAGLGRLRDSVAIGEIGLRELIG
jgi:protein-histidine pros-kinase